MDIKKNLLELKSEINSNTVLVAVSKTKPIEDLKQAYDAGQRDFGENKVQEMVDKFEELPKDIRWHMIGHVQTNKVKYMVEFVHLIHGVDSFKLLKEINKRAKKIDRIINVLLQIKIAEEDSKFGMSEEEALQLLQTEKFKNLTQIQVQGLMGMATFTDDEEVIKNEFEKLRRFYKKLAQMDLPNTKLSILSMGMSGDYHIAQEMGSNMIRVGSRIFGSRNY